MQQLTHSKGVEKNDFRCRAIYLVYSQYLRQAGVQPTRMSGAECAMLQGLGANRWTQEALRHLVGLSEAGHHSRIGEFWTHSSRKLEQPLHILGVPEWADWSAGELNSHKAVVPALGIECNPVLIKGEKEQFLDWLSCSVESEAVKFPSDPGSIDPADIYY